MSEDEKRASDVPGSFDLGPMGRPYVVVSEDEFAIAEERARLERLEHAAANRRELARLRAAADALEAEAVSVTPLAASAIAKIPAALARLRTSHQKASVSAVAVAIEVDRGTLTNWIDRGWVDPNSIGWRIPRGSVRSD